MINEIKKILTKYEQYEISIEKNFIILKVPYGMRNDAHMELRNFFLSSGINFIEKKTSKSKSMMTLILDDKTKFVVKPIGLSNNKGNQFETVFLKTLESGSYKDLHSFLNLKDPKFKHITKRRTRPLVWQNGIPIIKTLDAIGSTISDIEIYDGIDTHYLSLKKQSGTFCNVAIGKILVEEEIKANTLINASGKALLDFLKIDHGLFCDIFNLYKTDTKRDTTIELEPPSNIQALLKSAIGWGYILVQEKSDGSIKLFDMRDASVLEEMTRPLSYKIRYPIGTSKTLNIKIETPKMILNLDMRNKYGDIYPKDLLLYYQFI
jgi:hypothetical protein